MRIDELSSKDSGQWKQLLHDYLNNKKELQPLYGRPASIESFADQIKDKKANYSHRAALVEHLSTQYKNYKFETSGSMELISQLESEDTFTVTTGHQLCLFGGPAYFVYKIAGCISLAKELKEHFPNYNFIPVFWLASEDHDFEEIKSLELFGNKISWELEAKGPVGRLPVQSIDKALHEVKELFGQSENADYLYKILEDSYKNASTLSEATFNFTHQLFEDFELLCLDADSRTLKTCFKQVLQDELLNESASKELSKANSVLAENNYSQQVHVRDINLFYIEDNYRDRILKTSTGWGTSDEKYQWSKDELLNLLDEAPEKYSPNAALRPLYQEVILPNLAYVGGGGEMSYWLQLKPIFDYHKVDFPVLMPRLSATAVLPSVAKKVEKLGLAISSYFQPNQDLVKEYLASQTSIVEFDEEKQMLNSIEESLLSKMADLDEGFRKSVSSNLRNMEKMLDGIYAKYRKQFKQREEISLNQLESVQSQLYPHAKLQERVENFAYWYLRTGKDGLHELVKHMRPFQFNMLMMHL